MISKSSIKSRREKHSKGIDLTTRLHERYGEEHKAPLYPNLSKSSGTSHNGNNTEIPNKPLKPLVDNQHLDLISNESLFIQRSTSAKADNSNMQITKITEKGKSKKNKIVKLTDSELTIPRKSVITMQSNTSKRQRYVQIPVNQSNTSKQQRHVQIPVNPSISKQTTLTDPNFQRKGTIKNKSEIKGNIVQQHKTGTGFLESALYVGKEITKTAPEPLHPLTPIQDKHVTDQTYLDKTHINNLELSLEPENRLQKIRPTTDLYLGKPVHSLKETPIIGTELSNKDKSIINISNRNMVLSLDVNLLLSSHFWFSPITLGFEICSLGKDCDSLHFNALFSNNLPMRPEGLKLLPCFNSFPSSELLVDEPSNDLMGANHSLFPSYKFRSPK
jgi:hypothetical protein